MEYSLQAILAQPALLSGVPDETLRAWIERYPYVPLFRIEQYKRTRTYDDALQASFRIHNREILYQLMYGRDEMPELAVPEAEAAVASVPEEDRIEQPIPVTEELAPVYPETALSPEITEEIAADTDTPVIEVNETILPAGAEAEATPGIPEPEEPAMPVSRSIADDVLESIRRLKLERETKNEPEAALTDPAVQEPIQPQPLDELVPEPVEEVEVLKAPEPEPLIPVPDIEIPAPAELFEAKMPEPEADTVLEALESEPVVLETPVAADAPKVPETEGLYIPEVEEDVIEGHQEAEVETDKASQVEAAAPEHPIAEPVSAGPAEIYIPPMEEERPPVPEPAPAPEPAPVYDNSPHTFIEWISMIDGGVSIEKPFDTQPKEEWIEIPRYELEFQQAHKNVYKVEDFEGELDQAEDLDEDLNRVAGESVEFKQDMMTETLAKIYLKQGKIEKALTIYNTLRLKFPEKSAYFAALIQNLEKGE